ncbi:MAG: sulfatase-like hydrolase/transferase [Candidatus Eisenbacteria bacterium]|nr:sulfatase-like hydrolase/transferase [Candidatus Eisenbacteria bacterium]
MNTRLTTSALLSVIALLVALTWTGCGRAPERPNMVVIVTDTVRRDYTGPAGRSPSPTPALDRLASEGTVFTDAWANGPWTVPSHASIFSGLLPSQHHCTGRSYRFESESPTFAELLSEDGYDAVAFYSNPWLTDTLTGMLRGFEQHVVKPEERTNMFNQSDQGGPETVRNVERWLAERDRSRPFVLFVNLLEPHLPYAPPDDYRQRRLPDLPPDYVFETQWALEYNARVRSGDRIDFAEVAKLYEGDVFAADRHLGEIVELVRAHAGDDETVYIATSDHGENLGDHGYMDHQFGVFDTLIEVPLVVVAPGALAPGRRDDPVMLTDLYDTILDLSGIEDGPDTPHSRSLLEPPAHEDRPLITEYMGANPALVRALKSLNPELDTTREELAFSKVRVGNLEYTVASDGRETLYDLDADPERTDNLAFERPETADLMLELMPAVRRESAEELEVDEEMKEWLRSLGYVQ